MSFLENCGIENIPGGIILELHAYSLWCIHMGIMNSPISVSDQTKLQNFLRKESQVYLTKFQNSFEKMKKNDFAALHKTMVVIQHRAVMYNDAFNAGKGLSFDYSIDDYDLYENELNVLCKHIGHYDSSTENILRSASDTVKPLMAQLLAESIAYLQ